MEIVSVFFGHLHHRHQENMINRNYIRIKVLEALFAYKLNKGKDIHAAEVELKRNMTEFYALYIKILALIPTLARMDAKILEQKKSRYLPTEEDLKPNFKFADNSFIRQIDENRSLEKAIQDYSVNWNNDLDLLFVKTLYQKLSSQDYFREYLKNSDTSYQSDKDFVLKMVEDFLMDNEDCINYLGNIRLHWQLDYNQAVILVYNTLQKNFNENQSNEKKIHPLFKKRENETISEEELFLNDLFRDTLQHNDEFESLIEKGIRNWEMDRIATIDMILLKMAICEFIYMPSIPVRVTLNEYIELAKYYSSPKSRNFVNGVLDNVLTQLKEENRLQKRGRGLMG